MDEIATDVLLIGVGEKPCRESNLVINYRGSKDRDENALAMLLLFESR